VLSLGQELEICDRVLEPLRCAMLDAVLSRGTVAEHDFPVQMATFGGSSGGKARHSDDSF
jgi:hypothetical protein